MLSEEELALLVFVLPVSSFGVLGYVVFAGVCRGVCRCFA